MIRNPNPSVGLDGLGMFPNVRCKCKMSISCTRNNMVGVARQSNHGSEAINQLT